MIKRKIFFAGIIVGVAAIVASIPLWQRYSRYTDVSRASSSAVLPAPLGGASPASSEALSWRSRVMAANLDQLQGLLQEALALKDPLKREEMVAAVLAAWINRDARHFSKYFSTLEVLLTMEDSTRGIITAALKKALTMLRPEVASSDAVLSVVEKFIAFLAKADPREALRWANEWLLDDARDSALVPVAREMARLDPGGALEVIGQVNNQLRRIQAMAAVGGVWAEKDPAGAFAWADAMKVPAERALTVNSVLLSTAQTDIPGAAARLAGVQASMAREYTATRAASLAAAGLTEADLANDSEGYRDMLASGAIAPPTSPDVELLADAARVISTKLAETDPAAAVAFTESIGNDFLKLKSVTGALRGWAASDGASAVQFYQAKYPQYGEMLAAVYEGWAEASPLRAAEGTALVADPLKRSTARQVVVESWAAAGEASVVADWMDTLPAIERSDSMELALVKALSATNPEASWQRAQRISDEKLRFRALKSAFSILATERPAVAESLLASTTLSARDSERLGEMLRAVR